MSAVVVNEVRGGFYLDSVALMQISASLAALPGIEDAVAMIGTPSNLEIMREAGLLAPSGEAAGPNDLVVAVRAGDGAAAEAALAHARKSLERELAPAGEGDWRPRTLDGALDGMAGANLVLVSTPGPFAVREARRALDRGLNVMLFSDNVPLEAERALKERAHALGLLVMGPDCGTAYIAGTPLAFANFVPRGRVGVIAASGTGLQEVAVLLARAGAGISHGIGVGGRDLSDAVGGPSTLDAIDLLASDAGTDHLILVSKPPGPRTARRVLARLAASGKPCTAVVFGADGIEVPPGGPVLVPTLKDAVERAAGRPIASDYDAAGVARREAARLAAGRRALRGLFCGGTLATEALAVLGAAGVDAASGPASPAPAGSNAPHRVIDLGADEFTVGRPHPMIDPALRTERLREALADREVAVVLLDVVLGLGAHPDPARPVCDAVRESPAVRGVVGEGSTVRDAARAGSAVRDTVRTGSAVRDAVREGSAVRDAAGEGSAVRDAAGESPPVRAGPVVVASVCGTDDDPQGYARQVAMLVRAGVLVAPSNADAAALAVAILRHAR